MTCLITEDMSIQWIGIIPPEANLITGTLTGYKMPRTLWESILVTLTLPLATQTMLGTNKKEG